MIYSNQLTFDHPKTMSNLSLQVPAVKSHQRIRSADFKVKESLSLSPTDAGEYRKTLNFDDLIQLNVEFLERRKKSSPYTTKLQPESTPLLKQLVEINKLGLLTVCSSTGDASHKDAFTKAHVQGIIMGESRLELLDVSVLYFCFVNIFKNILNQSDLICFFQACNVPGYKEEEDTERDILYDVNMIQIPYKFKLDSHTQKYVVDECVTPYNWITHLKTTVSSDLYEKLANECFNVYIVDPTPKRNANNEKDGLLQKIISALKEISK